MKQFRSDFDVTARLFENKYGIKLQLGAIKFSDIEFHAKLTGLVADPFGEAARSVNTDIAVVTPGPRVAGRGDQFIQSMASMHGINLELSPKGFIGSQYRIPSKRSIFTITGINERAPKFCVQVKTDSGAQYKMPVTMLASAVLIGHKE
jgi:hypothetical protein